MELKDRVKAALVRVQQARTDEALRDELLERAASDLRAVLSEMEGAA
jgi:hypothetical protein